MVAGLQEWSDEYARFRERLKVTQVNADAEDPCAQPRALFEEYSGALGNAPTPAVASAWSALLTEARYTFGQCLALGMDMAQIQSLRLRNLHQAVVAAIFEGGANYNGS